MSTLLDEQGRSDARAEKVVWAIHSDTTQWAPRQNYQPNTLKVTTWLHHRFLDFQTNFTKYIVHLEHETKRSAQNYLSKFYRNFGQNVGPATKKTTWGTWRTAPQKKGVAFRQEVSQNDPFAPNILKKRGSAPPKTLYLAQRTRHAHENAAPLERSPATLSVRGFFHKQKIKARRTFSYHRKKQQKRSHKQPINQALHQNP